MRFKVTLTLASILLIVLHTNAGNVHFTSESFPEALANARKNNTLLMTYVGASWCIPCNIMEQSTFANLEITRLLEKDFYPVKVSIESGVGPLWAAEFQVETVPTLLYFNHNGKIIKRTEHSLTSDEMISDIKGVLQFIDHGSWPFESTPALSEPAVAPLLVPNEEVALPASVEVIDPRMNYSYSSGTTTSEKPKIILQSTFKVFVGRFPQGTAMEPIITTLKKSHSTSDIFINGMQLGNQRLYQVFVGRFKEFAAALTMEKKLQSLGYDQAYVITEE